jgi:fused signal recognition particle receptor
VSPRLLWADVPATPVADSSGALVGLLLVLGLAVLAVLVLRKVLGRRGPSTLPPPPKELPGTQGEALTPVTPKVKVELAPSEAEARTRAEAEEAKAKADALRAERAKLAQGDAQAVALKEAEEEARKAAYRAQKATEVEEKERKKREREEAARHEALAAEQARAEAAAREAAAKAEAARKVEAEAGQTLAVGLSKTRSEGFMARLNGLFGGGPRAIDEKVLAELEEVLFTADIGVKTASRLVELAREKAKSKEAASAEGLKGVLRQEIARIVDLKGSTTLKGGGPPHVVMVVGVNGAGKTTTIGKLAAKAVGEGRKVVLAAGDTFRAAAAEQLDVWATRAGAEVVKGAENADPASVVFQGVKHGVETGAALVIADTAGRLHTKVTLMDELKKVRRVIDKALPGAPHEVLLVLDATNGQNAIAQARQFHEAVGVTAIALTKLDGTAKGGVIIGICDELKIPVAWVGVGEKVADLRPFDPKEFVAALFD